MDAHRPQHTVLGVRLCIRQTAGADAKPRARVPRPSARGPGCCSAEAPTRESGVRAAVGGTAGARQSPRVPSVPREEHVARCSPGIPRNSACVCDGCIG